MSILRSVLILILLVLPRTHAQWIEPPFCFDFSQKNAIPISKNKVQNLMEPTNSLFDIEIRKPDYITNDGLATFCKRDPEVVDTIVVHHTATSERTTPEEINEMHLNRNTGGEPWYMIGYNFLVSQDSYTSSNISYTQGRPVEAAGAHAGGSIVPSKETKDLIDKTEISCGSYTNGFETLPMNTKIINGKINANQTTFGVAVIGNYAPKKYVKKGGVILIENETGYNPKGKIRYPSDAVLRGVAKLSCEIQKKYPRVKKFKPHQFYKQTECPGSVKQRLSKLVQFAKEFSCDFSL